MGNKIQDPDRNDDTEAEADFCQVPGVLDQSSASQGLVSICLTQCGHGVGPLEALDRSSAAASPTILPSDPFRARPESPLFCEDWSRRRDRTSTVATYETLQALGTKRLVPLAVDDRSLNVLSIETQQISRIEAEHLEVSATNLRLHLPPLPWPLNRRLPSLTETLTLGHLLPCKNSPFQHSSHKLRPLSGLSSLNIELSGRPWQADARDFSTDKACYDDKLEVPCGITYESLACETGQIDEADRSWQDHAVEQALPLDLTRMTNEEPLEYRAYGGTRNKPSSSESIDWDQIPAESASPICEELPTNGETISANAAEAENSNSSSTGALRDTYQININHMALRDSIISSSVDVLAPVLANEGGFAERCSHQLSPNIRSQQSTVLQQVYSSSVNDSAVIGHCNARPLTPETNTSFAETLSSEMAVDGGRHTSKRLPKRHCLSTDGFSRLEREMAEDQIKRLLSRDHAWVAAIELHQRRSIDVPFKRQKMDGSAMKTKPDDLGDEQEKKKKASSSDSTGSEPGGRTNIKSRVDSDAECRTTPWCLPLVHHYYLTTFRGLQKQCVLRHLERDCNVRLAELPSGLGQDSCDLIFDATANVIFFKLRGLVAAMRRRSDTNVELSSDLDLECMLTDPRCDCTLVVLEAFTTLDQRPIEETDLIRSARLRLDEIATTISAKEGSRRIEIRTASTPLEAAQICRLFAESLQENAEQHCSDLDHGDAGGGEEGGVSTVVKPHQVWQSRENWIDAVDASERTALELEGNLNPL